MARYIDADELINEINNTYDGYMTEEQYPPTSFEKMVDEAPITDVVERFKIDKAIAEIMDIDWYEIIRNYDDVEMGFKSEVEKILRRNIGA